MKKIILILMLFSLVLHAQVEYSGVSSSTSALVFYFDAAVFKSNVPNKTRIDLFVQVPYSSIQFIKTDNGFQANYSVILTFLDEEKKNILFERVWKERVVAADFEQTISKNNFNLSYKNYDLLPGKYFLKCSVEDSDSRRTSLKEFPLNVRQIPDSLGISDLMFISEVIKDSTGNKIIPNVSATVTNKNSSLSFYFDIYSNKRQDVILEYSLNNLKNNTSFKQSDPRLLKAGVNLITHTISSTSFSLGDYSLSVTLRDQNWKEIVTIEKKLYSKIFGIPSSIADLDKAVNQMRYIASPPELDFIKEGKDYAEKLNRFLAFWDKKKPNQKSDENPILYEYYRRIDYANKNFKGVGEGWRSDMGMIYVTFGPPSNVERHPFDAYSKPYEIWSYYELNRSFIFSDITGFGDYRLVNPDYSRWPGYRP
ncbi:MAG: GWxTD domain-containing protein [Bacteroidota bacterium]